MVISPAKIIYIVIMIAAAGYIFMGFLRLNLVYKNAPKTEKIQTAS